VLTDRWVGPGEQARCGSRCGRAAAASPRRPVLTDRW